MNMRLQDRGPSGIREMFGSLAGRYDLMNTIITLGRVGAWRRKMVRAASLSGPESVLDVGTGTGAIAREFVKTFPKATIAGCDFSARMLKTARASSHDHNVHWCLADALCLPFNDRSFDLVTSGYLVRNVSDLQQAFSEQARVLKPGGVLLCLETGPPPPNVFRPAVTFYLRHVLPLLGRMVAGSRGSYSYLAESTAGFETAAGLAEIVASSGLEVSSTESFMFGTQVLLKAIKQ